LNHEQCIIIKQESGIADGDKNFGTNIEKRDFEGSLLPEKNYSTMTTHIY